MRYGPQPFEGLVSAVCQEFTIAPDVAIRQDWPMVQAVMEYRRASEAMALVRAPAAERDRAFRVLTESPGMLELLAKLHRAQTGQPLEGGDLVGEGAAVAELHAPAATEDDD